MTSRVIDGHRKQELAASSSWNSLLIKSERAKATSCISNSSFVNLADNRASMIGQSASFRGVPRPMDGLISVGGNEPTYVPVMTDNLERNGEQFSLQGENRFGGSKSNMSLSARDHPSQNNYLQMQ